MTADCRDEKDIEKNYGGKIQLAIYWSGSSHLHLWKNPIVQVILLPNLGMGSLASFIPELY